MNASFGIDHPLVATHDIDALRDRLISMGFNMTAIGRHPWGTSTSLAMFDGCLLEIMGIYDESLIDEIPAGDFRFGRHVFEHLQEREGVALTALHSLDSENDAKHAEEVGFKVSGHLEFGRDVQLPDGSADRTKTTLALIPDKQYPRLSFFLCQQHRPELIYVPEWLKHPNTVNGICAVNIVADVEHQASLKKRFGGLYKGYESLDGGFLYQTANGVIRVLQADAFTGAIGKLAPNITKEPRPFIAGMDFTVANPLVLKEHLDASTLSFQETANGYALTAPDKTANTVFRFFA